MKELIKEIRRFVDDRNWNQFHSPENLTKSISIEAAELLECFQWDGKNFNKEDVCEELADVFLYSVSFFSNLMSILNIAKEKDEKNVLKIPVSKA